MREVMEPTVRGLMSDGTPYLGFLYAGVMIAPDGTPNVLEFNCRFGDPETQPIMMRLKSDLTDLCEAALDQRLGQVEAYWDDRAAVGVVLAAGGYPDAYAKGKVIYGLEAAAELPGKVFHAGTKLIDGKVTTNGGRVLCAVGLGKSVSESQQQRLRTRRPHPLGRYSVPPRHRVPGDRARKENESKGMTERGNG